MAKILLVDDEVSLCELLSTVLELNGYEVKFCHGGYEAIDLLKTEDFDLVLSDVRMPMGDGVELGEWVSTHRSKLPMIFMSGGGNVADQRSEFLRGWPRLSKPIRHDVLVRKIEQALSLG